jgi:hypothetical protein
MTGDTDGARSSRERAPFVPVADPQAPGPGGGWDPGRKGPEARRTSGLRTWRTNLSDDTAVDAILPAGPVVCVLGLIAPLELSTACELGNDPAPLPMGFGVRVGGPEAPGDRSLVGTEVGIRAGYATVRGAAERG